MQTNDHDGDSVGLVPSATPIPEDVLRRRRALGERIRLARESADITQERLAELVGLTRVSISNVETGRHSPTVDRLIMIADAVRVPPSHLMRELTLE
jgi:DNA-binding XRE family transcriptional regulator